MERAILKPKNNTAASIKDSLLDQLPDEIVKYKSVDSAVKEVDTLHNPAEFLQTFNLPHTVFHLTIYEYFYSANYIHEM